MKRVVLRNFAKFTGKHLRQSIFFNNPMACNFIKKEALAQLFSREFCKTFKNIFFTEHRMTASEHFKLIDIRIRVTEFHYNFKILNKFYQIFCFIIPSKSRLTSLAEAFLILFFLTIEIFHDYVCIVTSVLRSVRRYSSVRLFTCCTFSIYSRMT